MTSGRTAAFTVLSIVLCITLLSTGRTVAQKPRTPDQKGLQWTNLEEAITKASDQKKAILLDVYTDWCGWCKKMDKEVFAHPAVAEVLSSRFALAKVNGESREEFTYKGKKTNGVGIAQGFGVRGYPSIIFLDSNGDMLTLIPGFVDAEKFLPVALFIGNKEYEKMEWDAFLASYNASKKPSPGSK